MKPFIKRAYVSAFSVIAVGLIMYFILRSNSSPLTKGVVFFGGAGFLFIIIKSYLFKM